MPPLSELLASDVALIRGERLVQHGVNFRIGAGGCLALGGRNGAGKTSLLRAVAGLLELRAGSITIRLSDGRALSSGDDRGSLCGWIGHQDGVKPQLTPAEHLRFDMKYLRRSASIDEPLDRCGLAELCDVAGQYLSAGQRRRLALARLIAADRPLWLLDEPLAALDRDGKRLVQELIRTHCALGGIALAATHEPIGSETCSLDLA